MYKNVRILLGKLWIFEYIFGASIEQIKNRKAMEDFEVLKDEEMASLKGGYWAIDPWNIVS